MPVPEMRLKSLRIDVQGNSEKLALETLPTTRYTVSKPQNQRPILLCEGLGESSLGTLHNVQDAQRKEPAFSHSHRVF